MHPPSFPNDPILQRKKDMLLVSNACILLDTVSYRNDPSQNDSFRGGKKILELLQLLINVFYQRFKQNKINLV